MPSLSGTVKGFDLIITAVLSCAPHAYSSNSFVYSFFKAHCEAGEIVKSSGNETQIQNRLLMYFESLTVNLCICVKLAESLPCSALKTVVKLGRAPVRWRWMLHSHQPTQCLYRCASGSCLSRLCSRGFYCLPLAASIDQSRKRLNRMSMCGQLCCKALESGSFLWLSSLRTRRSLKCCRPIAAEMWKWFLLPCRWSDRLRPRRWILSKVLGWRSWVGSGL